MATTPIKYPTINGFGFSFASMSATIDCEATGVTFDLPAGFSAINYNRERDLGEGARGPHPDPLFKVRGQNKYTGSIKRYKQRADYIKTEVLGGAGHGDRIFRLTVQYAEEGSDTKTDVLIGCTWDKDGSDNAKGTDPTEIEVTLSPLKVLFSGEDDVDNPLVAAA